MSGDSRRLGRVDHVVGQHYLGGWQGHFSPKHCYPLTTIIRALDTRKQCLQVIVNKCAAQASKKETERDLISSDACVNLWGNVRTEVKVSSCCRLRLGIFFSCCFPIPGEIFNLQQFVSANSPDPSATRCEVSRLHLHGELPPPVLANLLPLLLGHAGEVWR